MATTQNITIKCITHNNQESRNGLPFRLSFKMFTMGFFDRFKKKKEELLPFALQQLGLDLHSHLIPGIDDGSKSMDDSLELARGLVSLGYHTAITTPHIMSDFYKNSPDNIIPGYNSLVQELENASIPLKLQVAAEYYVDYDFLKKIGKEKLLTFGKNYILIECSFVESPKILKEAIFELQTNGYKPILAHPERYPYWHHNFAEYEALKDREVLFQLNLLSLTGYYSPMVKNASEQLITRGWIDLLGTDLHNANHMEMLHTMHVSDNILPLLTETCWKNSSLL